MKLTKTKCKCGAITIDGIENGKTIFSNSMSPETYNKVKYRFDGFEMDDDFNDVVHCNHCINNWGIDLCNCGSGEKVGECENEFYDCRNEIPAQSVFEMKKWEFKF